MGNLSKEEKRAMLKAWKAGQKRNHILKKKDVKKLFDYLESELEKSPCDNTLKHTEKWVVENYEKKASAVMQEIRDMGGFCDCEVIMNCYEDYELA